MSKLNKAIELAFTAKLKESNGKLNQTDRNALRQTLLDALAEDLGAVMTVEGLVVEIPHEEWGTVFAEVNIKMKDTDFDIIEATAAYATKLADRTAKEKEKEAKAAERAAKDKAIKDSKEIKAKATK